MVPAIALHSIGKDFIPAQIAKVHVDIRQAHPAGVEKALEIQIKGQGIHPGDVQQVGDDAAPGGAPAGAHGNALVPGKAHQVPADEKVSAEPHGLHNPEFPVQALPGFPLIPGVAAAEPPLTQLPQELLIIFAKAGQINFAQGQLSPRLFRKCFCPGNGLGPGGKDGRHLRWRQQQPLSCSRSRGGQHGQSLEGQLLFGFQPAHSRTSGDTGSNSLSQFPNEGPHVLIPAGSQPKIPSRQGF